MALAADSLRDCVAPEKLAEFDKVAHKFLEDPERHPELVREPGIMKLEMKHAVCFFLM